MKEIQPRTQMYPVRIVRRGISVTPAKFLVSTLIRGFFIIALGYAAHYLGDGAVAYFWMSTGVFFGIVIEMVIQWLGLWLRSGN